MPVTTTGAYDVYARWVADPTHATNATYTVHYAGGSTPVTVNQTQDGGTWQLLGTFTLDPALNPQVVLSDQANGPVVADAVLVVPSGTSTDRVTYTPTLPSATTVDIYAKWGENANRAHGVRYAIQHSGGSTDITVNQQQPSGGWAHLGAFAMAPGQNHGVDVYGALEGETVGDAIRFVTAGVSAPGIHYVHADHLGSPQKMTDSTKTLVWDAVLTPYGLVHSLTGTGTNNRRFPGQYADAETGFHYNYFRDYDPTTGRYVQSDPIGLGGGLNTYGYVNGNPGKWMDPLGLFIPDHHDLATRLAARKVGCDKIADKLGEKTAGVDSLPGSQDAKNSFVHAMRDGLRNQSVETAEALYSALIEANSESTNPDDLALALHALQDSFSPAHEGFQPWYGAQTPLSDLIWHGIQDFIAGFTSDFQAAVDASVNLLKKAKELNPCLCKK